MNTELGYYCDTEKLIAVAIKKGYRIFDSPLGYDMNTFIVRANKQKAGSFDDILVSFYRDNTNWVSYIYGVTADPSDLSLMNYKNPRGCAIVKPGQYPGSHCLGLHKGKYKALVQCGKMCVIRDYNKDAILDFNMPTNIGTLTKRITNHNTGQLHTWIDVNGNVLWSEDYGYFGINVHRASAYKILEKVGLYSEGCTVHQNPTPYTNEFIPLYEKAADMWGNKFTTTYITEQDLIKI